MANGERFQRVWKGTAEEFGQQFNFFLSNPDQAVMDRAEGLGLPVTAIIADYPFCLYLLILYVDEEEIK